MSEPVRASVEQASEGTSLAVVTRTAGDHA